MGLELDIHRAPHTLHPKCGCVVRDVYPDKGKSAHEVSTARFCFSPRCERIAGLGKGAVRIKSQLCARAAGAFWLLAAAVAGLRK